MEVTFYTNASDKRTLNKSISKIRTIQCSIKDPCTLLAPSISLLKDDLPEWNRCNYAYINEFDRYYFMGQPRLDTAGRLNVDLSIDPLMSNRAAILGISCIIERSETVYNKMIKDELAPVRSARAIRYVRVGAMPSESYYYITCDGGVDGTQKGEN